MTAAVGAAAAFARPARADCPVALAGDPDTVGRVARALAAFGGDDAPCVSVRATCAPDPDPAHIGGIVIELQDAFGRVARRTFASVDGAVALLVSWSHRPVPLSAPGATPPAPAIEVTPPGATATLTAHAAPPAPPPVEVDAPRVDHPPQPLFGGDRQLELRFEAIGAPVEGNTAFDVEGAFVQRSGIFRYGVDVRFLETTGDPLVTSLNGTTLSTMLGLDVSGVLGIALGTGRWLGHAEVGLGGATIGGVSDKNTLVYQSQGLRIGARAGVDVRLAGTMWLELGGGWDGLLRLGPEGSANTFFSQWSETPHLDAGLLWVL